MITITVTEQCAKGRAVSIASDFIRTEPGFSGAKFRVVVGDFNEIDGSDSGMDESELNRLFVAIFNVNP